MNVVRTVLRWSAFAFIAFVAGVTIGQLAPGSDAPTNPPTFQTLEDVQIQQSHVAQEMESYILSQPHVLLAEVMPNIGSADCEDWAQVENDEMVCWYTSYPNESGLTVTAHVTFDVSDASNPFIVSIES